MNLTIECILRIVLSCLLGAAIGFERSKRLKEAGVRTHCIIAAAAALLMVVSKYGFTDLSMENGEMFAGTRGADAARIAAQVVSGISFLGVGVIFRNGNSVKGLTTAAGIWATAASGLAIGAGLYVLGVTLTLVVVAIQLIFHHYSIGNDVYSENDVKITALSTPEFRDWFFGKADQKEIQILSIRMDRQEDGREIYTISFRTRRNVPGREVIEKLETAPGIISYTV